MAPMTVERVEAPVTVRGYLMCAFAAFAGILFGYDSGYINGVIGTGYVSRLLGHYSDPVPNPKTNKLPPPLSEDSSAGNLLNYYALATSRKALIVSILSAGTFFGAILSGAFADWFGRRLTIIIGCGIFIIGVIMQAAMTHIPLFVVGRLVAGFGVGFVSAINILYMSEVAPKRVRGAIVSCYQFAITIGIMLASIVTNSVKNRLDTGSYRIPICIQFAWALILATGLFLLPESPRWYVKKQRLDEAARALARLRGQSVDSDFIQDELAEIQANYEFELQVGETTWLGLLSGGIGNRNSNFRRVFTGTTLQMMQQWTGVNFIFYYSTTFFQAIGLDQAFIYSIITTIVNVCSTPISFYTIEKFGRRPLLIGGATAMCICEFIVAITGSATDFDNNAAAGKALIAFVCIYIFWFASTWGPGAWVCIGELFPLPIRSKGVALSTASNWFWNCIIGVITPYMVDPDKGNLGTKVFYVWGSTCAVCIVFAYLFVYETKGLSLEQVDKMMDEVSARNSSRWRPSTTFAAEMGLKEDTAVTEIAEKVKAHEHHNHV